MLVRCRAACDVAEIVAAAGLDLGDPFPLRIGDRLRRPQECRPGDPRKSSLVFAPAGYDRCEAAARAAAARYRPKAIGLLYKFWTSMSNQQAA